MSFKTNRFYISYPELKAKFHLKSTEFELICYLYSHCINLHKGGFCGYSNENLGKFICASVDQVKRALTRLKALNLITIENPQSLKRRIYVNEELFNSVLTDEAVSADQEADKAKIKALEEEIERLKQALEVAQNAPQKATEAPNQPQPGKYEGYAERLIQGLEDELIGRQIREIRERVSPAYYRFAYIDGFGEGLLKAHIDYLINRVRTGKTNLASIKDISSYLLEALNKFKAMLEDKRNTDQSMKNQKVQLPDWYDEVPDQTPINPEEYKKFKAKIDEELKKAKKMEEENKGKKHW